MTESELRALIAAGESLDIEFKGEERRPLSDHDLVEAVVCMANRPGDRSGYVLIGVEDDGRITGARPRHEAGITDLWRVQALISGRTRPALTVQAAILKAEGKPVLSIAVPSVRQPVGTTDGRYVRRAIGGDGKPACLPFHFHEMQSLQSGRGLLDYSAVVVPEAAWQDLDPLEFERFRRSIRESGGRGDAALLSLSDQELAKALGAVAVQSETLAIRVLGLLLFGKEQSLFQYLPSHEVAFQQLRGQKVEVNDFVRWPLIRVMEDFLARFRARNKEEELMVGMVRVGIPLYPEIAFREALANALIHRDYTRLGAVHVQWHADRIEISNPGGFPDGVRLDNLLVVPPTPRNPLLADAFKRAGLVERTARGIDALFYEHLRFGKKPPIYSRSSEVSVVVSLPGGKPDLAFARFVAERVHRGDDPALDDLLLLRALVDDRSIQADRAATVLQKSLPETEMALVRLGNLKWAQRVNGGGWRLSDALHSRLGVKLDRRSVETPIDSFEEKIIQWAQAHGRITRSETAALCGVSSDQAKRILAGIVKKGTLIQRGKRRGVYYEPVPK